MPTEPSPQPPSFSPRNRWKIGFDLCARTLLVLAAAVMLNFIGAQFFHRFYLSSRTRVQLYPRTLSVVHSLTNQVKVTLYYDRGDDFYPDIVALLKEYQAANPKISFQTVDPVRNPGEAEEVKAQYRLNTSGDKNLIIFDAGRGRVQICSGDALIQHAPTGISEDKKIIFGPVAFRGEEMFTAALLALQRSSPFKAYFLQGDGEPSLTDSGDFGYMKFGEVLAQNYIAVANLELSAARDVPADCNLLIYIAPGVPTAPLPGTELQEIDQYLAQGGRLLVLFNYTSSRYPTGLEPILQRWGVNVVADFVRDPEHTMTGDDIKVTLFGHHPAVDPLAGNGLALQIIRPRPVIAIKAGNSSADAPQVTELAFSSDSSVLDGDPAAPPRRYPLIAAVEQKNTAGIVNTRGTTRIIVAGDSIFLGNHYIAGGSNGDFLGYAVNWLLDRTQLLEGIGPQPVTEFRLLMTRLQQREIRWLLLGALPGAVLLLGGLVWLARRK